MDFLPKIKQPFLFHVTLTSYLSDIEPFVPKKTETIKNNFAEDLINEQMRRHNPNSSLLIGELTEQDVVTVRKDNAIKGKRTGKKKSDEDAQTSLLNNERHD